MRRKNKNLKNRLPAKKAQDLPPAPGGRWCGACPLPHRLRKNRLPPAEAIPAMQRQGGKTCPWRDFCLGFFSLQNRAYSPARRVDKKPISVAPISPPAPSSKPLDTPLLPARPFSQRPSEGARGVCIVTRHVRGQGKDGGGGAAQRSPSHRQRQ